MKEKTILCVDDEQAIVSSIKRLFHSRQNYTVISAKNGREAMEILSAGRPDLLILDVMMPGINGYDILDFLASNEKLTTLPVVLLSGLGSDDDILKGYHKGAVYYVTKPFDNTRIVNIVDYLIGDLPESERDELELQL